MVWCCLSNIKKNGNSVYIQFSTEVLGASNRFLPSLLQVTTIDENETQLLRQSFMLNPSQTVYDYVSGHGAHIVDFYRVELGEDAKNIEKNWERLKFGWIVKGCKHLLIF